MQLQSVFQCDPGIARSAVCDYLPQVRSNRLQKRRSGKLSCFVLFCLSFQKIQNKSKMNMLVLSRWLLVFAGFALPFPHRGRKPQAAPEGPDGEGKGLAAKFVLRSKTLQMLLATIHGTPLSSSEE